METIFKKGMKVYDQIMFPNAEGVILEVKDCNLKYPIIVKTEKEEIHYTIDGRYFTSTEKTLSTKPYKAILEGFEQKSLTPTYEDAVKWVEDNSDYNTIYIDVNEEKEIFLSEKDFYAFDALRKLIILREYYNKGWKPNWGDDERKYVIFIEDNIITGARNYSYKRVLVFETAEIRDKFLEEQKELLEIAKPLL